MELYRDDPLCWANSHQKDLCVVPKPKPASNLPHNPVDSRLQHDAPSESNYSHSSDRFAETEKDTDLTHQWLQCSTRPWLDLPQARLKSSWWCRYCLQWFTAYRVLIALTIIVNVVILGLCMGLHGNAGGALTATAANLLASVLVRQEDLINLTFGIVAHLPSSLPLRLRNILANFHHYGGVHIGTALSALVWYIVFVAISTLEIDLARKAETMTVYHWVDITTCYAFLFTLLAICITAIPRFRQTFHNTFERTHRFAGWAALAVVWINSGIHSCTASTTLALYKSPATWLLAATSFLIILPWLRIHRVPITATPISAKEAKLTFPFANMPYTSTTRFSTSPLTEWHAFATIPSPSPGSSSIIVSAAGDWTRAVTLRPPTHLWIRRPPTLNFLAFTPLFRSVLLVATGAGIGPLLSLLTSPVVRNMKSKGKTVRVLWCVYDAQAPRWAFVHEAICRVDSRPVVLSSRLGRPDVAFEARYLAEVHDLEAVMVVSNRKVTGDVVRAVEEGGRVAFGAVFDS